MTMNMAGATPLDCLSKLDSSALGNQTLFTFTGDINFIIWGVVTSDIQNQATTCKLSVVSDSLTAYDICANLNIQAFVAGSLLSITGTAANAMVGTTGVGAIAPGQASFVHATCITSGTITVTYGAASTGAILWKIKWVPLTGSPTVS